MIIFAREDKNLALQASRRADEQVGGNGGVESRDDHLKNMSIDPLGHQFQSARRGRGGLADAGGAGEWGRLSEIGVR